MARLLFVFMSVIVTAALFVCYVLQRQTFGVLRMRVGCCHDDDATQERISFGRSLIVKSHVESPNSITGTKANQRAAPLTNESSINVYSYHFEHSQNTGSVSVNSVPEDSKDKSSEDYSENRYPRSCEGYPECLSLRQLLSSWPKDKPRAVIYLLTQAKRLNILYETLRQLDKHFNAAYRYPIVIFHENDFHKKRRSIRNTTNSAVFFQTVNFRIPTFLKKKIVFDIPCLSHVSYRHMCRFQAKTVYDYPILDGLDYVWRLDDDSEILSNVTYDLFKFMQIGGYLYGHRLIHVDALSCTEGLWEATEKFIGQYNITPEFFKEWPRPKIYYNNFEISAMKLWKSEIYKQYVDYIDSLGGIYYHRWGDAPIKSIAVSLFVPSGKVHCFKDIAYRHQSTVLPPNVTSILPDNNYLFTKTFA